jgi:hypothetical protein
MFSRLSETLRYHEGICYLSVSLGPPIAAPTLRSNPCFTPIGDGKGARQSHSLAACTITPHCNLCPANIHFIGFMGDSRGQESMMCILSSDPYIIRPNRCTAYLHTQILNDRANHIAPLVGLPEGNAAAAFYSVLLHSSVAVFSSRALANRLAVDRDLRYTSRHSRRWA